ncbi:MAG: zinc ABC transporter substrate-binding protein [Pseudomonadota bacterium]
MSSRRSFLRSASAITAVSLALPMAAWADEPISVVATFSILGDMVAEVGGEHIELTTLVGPGGDAHVYQPTPQDAKAVAEADVMFINGLEFEGWLERLSEAASFGGEMVVATRGIDPIAFDEHGDEHHDDHDDHAEGEHHDEEHAEGEHEHEEHAEGEHAHDHDKEHAEGEHHDHEEHAEGEHHDEEEHAGHGDHHGHDHGAFDPHAWQSLEHAVTYVDNIAAGLAQADPENAGDYYANRAAYVAKLETLAAEVDAMMGAVPEDRRTVVTSHDAFQYFAEAYGMTFEAPQGLSTESEPSAADVAELITQIREEGISAVFVESITDNRLIEQIANETGATVGGTLYSDALSGEDGPASTYLDMMRHNATTLSQALLGS